MLQRWSCPVRLTNSWFRERSSSFLSIPRVQKKKQEANHHQLWSINQPRKKPKIRNNQQTEGRRMMDEEKVKVKMYKPENEWRERKGKERRHLTVDEGVRDLGTLLGISSSVRSSVADDVAGSFSLEVSGNVWCLSRKEGKGTEKTERQTDRRKEERKEGRNENEMQHIKHSHGRMDGSTSREERRREWVRERWQWEKSRK